MSVNPVNNLDSSVYFTAVLPWQMQSWQHLTDRYPRLPHGLLFAGMQGIGKRHFVWRFTAWLLCERRQEQPQTACGQCQSCLWLLAGTHPDLQVLPQSSLPLSADDASFSAEGQAQKKLASKPTADASKQAIKKDSIKVDDIRALQPFIHQGSNGRRVCVIDNADTMTVAAANALLKTLEEPRDGIHLLLITDMPTKLLPTIKSRVQQVAIHDIDRTQVNVYLAEQLGQQAIVALDGENKSVHNQDDNTGHRNGHHTSNNNGHNKQAILATHINQALALANGAPLAALAMLTAPWYAQRQAWLTTWLALRVGKRSSIAASDYWQTILPLEAFIRLSEIMLMELSRACIGMPALQTDLALEDYTTVSTLKLEAIYHLMQQIDDIKQAMQQNVQEKLGYDRLCQALTTL